MKGIYYYNTTKKEWIWHINYMGEQVASGSCKHRNEMREIIEKHDFVNWEKH